MCRALHLLLRLEVRLLWGDAGVFGNFGIRNVSTTLPPRTMRNYSQRVLHNCLEDGVSENSAWVTKTPHYPVEAAAVTFV